MGMQGRTVIRLYAVVGAGPPMPMHGSINAISTTSSRAARVHLLMGCVQVQCKCKW
jgi:hypothetical protein